MIIKMVEDQQFYWLEPFAFARARTKGAVHRGRFVSLLLVALMMGAVLGLSHPPESAKDVAVIALFSLGAGWLLAYPLVSLATRLPNDVLIASDRIVVGKEIIPFFEIASAVVGTMELGGRTFPVLTFLTRAGRQYVFGIARRVDMVKLAAFLEKSGVREPVE